VPVLRLPHLFDEPGLATLPDGTLGNTYTRSIRAFLPGAVNLQVLGNRLLIPRQYGPRMRPDHAVAVVKAALKVAWPDFKPPAMGSRWLHARGLDQSVCWLRERSDARLAGRAASVLAAWFADGFDKALPPAEIERRILAANRTGLAANGTLRDGWQRLVIPEPTVDLFETCIAAAVDGIGVELEWVDSWHYHVHGGEIHCGTNVLRSAPRR
jgi:hypothetical protein